ncbi:MAG: hypothetical protein ACOYXY_21920 [Thermodesulfobacteriota bacterium]
MPRKTTKQAEPPTPTDRTPIVPEAGQLDPETLETLLEMAAWWKRNRDKMLMPLPGTRPIFHRKKSVLRSVRLDERLIKAAEKKAKEERATTGGGFNQLVELLVWQWLGRPTEFLE